MKLPILAGDRERRELREAGHIRRGVDRRARRPQGPFSTQGGANRVPPRKSNERHRPLVEIGDLVDPEGRAHDRDINSDAYGRLYGQGERVQGHSTSNDVSPTQHEAERFAEQIRDYLYRAHSEQRFDKLWIVAPPAFLGILRDKLGKRLHEAIELDKDVPTHAMDAIRDIALAQRERHGGAGKPIEAMTEAVELRVLGSWRPAGGSN